MKLYTKRGDRGETSLFGGGRVRKNALRIEAYGAVDELNAALGVACSGLEDPAILAQLQVIQAALFDLGAELATPDVEEREARGKGIPRIREREIEEFESWLDEFEEELGRFRSFVLPGGDPGAALLHVARTVCRRAERRIVALAAEEEISPLLGRYVNRLSDLLFAMARAVNRRRGVEETTWVGRER